MGLQYAVKERVFNFDETKTKKYAATYFLVLKPKLRSMSLLR